MKTEVIVNEGKIYCPVCKEQIVTTCKKICYGLKKTKNMGSIFWFKIECPHCKSHIMNYKDADLNSIEPSTIFFDNDDLEKRKMDRKIKRESENFNQMVVNMYFK